jgi:hypothetical protein
MSAPVTLTGAKRVRLLCASLRVLGRTPRTNRGDA